MPRLSFDQLAAAIEKRPEDVRADPDRHVTLFKQQIGWHPGMGEVIITDRTDIKASVKDMAASIFNTLKGSARRALSGQPVLVPEAVRQERSRICHTCEHLRVGSGRCALCGCSAAKDAAAEYACPIGKWPAYSPSEGVE